MAGQVSADRIRLLLLAQQALFRTSLGRFLASEPTLEVVAECANSNEALSVLAGTAVNVVLLDCDDGPALRDEFMLAARRNAYYQGRFLAIAGANDLASVAEAIKLGASGIFLKSEAPDRLVQAITLVANGAVWLDHRTLQLLTDQSSERFARLADRNSSCFLTDREHKVLVGILSGLTNKKIGENLGLSEGTVKSCVQLLFHRAGVRKRSQLVRAALEGTLGTANSLFGPPAERLIV